MVLSCGQTDRTTESQIDGITDADECDTDATTYVSVSNKTQRLRTETLYRDSKTVVGLIYAVIRTNESEQKLI